MALLDISRYWGSDVSSGGGASVSVDGLHRLARQRAAARQSIGKQKEQEDTEPLAWDEDRKDTEPLAWDEDGGDTEPVAWDEDGGDTEPVAWDEDGEDTEEGQGEADCSVPMETEIGEKLLPVTHTIKSSLPVCVRAKHPAWISQPRLVERDIVSATAPLTSVPLPPIIICNLRSMGCTSLFPVQVKVLPSLLSSSSLPPPDVCVCAPTGCGKTLCYVVPMVTALLDCVVCQVRGVVVVPSQGLARQVAAVFTQVAAHTRVHCGLVCGDASLEKEAAVVSDSSSFPPASLVDVIVATPGRLAEHLMLGSFSSLQFLRFLVIDEADKLLSQQMYSWLPQLLQQATPSSTVGLSAWLQERSDVPHLFPPPLSSFPPPLLRPPQTQAVCVSQLLSTQQYIQKLMFSATMTQDPEALALLQLHRPVLFSVAVPEEGREAMMLTPPPSLHETMAVCKASLKPLVLLHFLSQHVRTSEEGRGRQVLCFTNSRESSQRYRLQVVLSHFNWFTVAVVTSGVSRQERRRVLQQFAIGAIQVLVCSDAMSRGMDLPACGCVVNYDPPSLYQMYLHRVGRTARAGNEGQALTLLAKEQVSAFHSMLRVAHRPKIEEVKVNLDLLQPLMDQYKEALLVLKDAVAHHKL